MLRYSAAVASRVMRLVGASSRPLIVCRKPIEAAAINPIRSSVQLVGLMPRLSAEQSRGYARGRAVVSSDEEDDDEEFDDEDCSDFEDFDDDEEDQKDDSDDE